MGGVALISRFSGSEQSAGSVLMDKVKNEMETLGRAQENRRVTLNSRGNPGSQRSQEERDGQD